MKPNPFSPSEKAIITQLLQINHVIYILNSLNLSQNSVKTSPFFHTSLLFSHKLEYYFM